MPDYRIFFTPDADEEVLKSYEWGVQYWGEEAAVQWLRDLYSVIFQRLAQFPFSYPLAPESYETERQVRHLIHGRYRILFEIRDDTIILLQLVGPFRGSSDRE